MPGSVTVHVHGDTSPLRKELKRLSRVPVDINFGGAPLGKIRGDLGEFEKSLAASNARVLAFGASAGIIMGVQQAFTEMVRSSVEVEKKLTEINTVLNTSNTELAKFGSGLFDIAKNTAQSFDTVAEAALEFARQGIGMEETLKRTNDALILTRISGLDAAASVNAITAALNGFQSAALTSTEVVSKMAKVDQAFAVSSADLAEALRRAGSTAESAGVSFDQLLAVVTATQQVTARGGNVIGNAFKTIFTRIQRPRVLEALEGIGIATKDAAGGLKPLMSILQNLALTYDNLAQSQQAQIAELVGGVFQINILKAAMSDLSRETSIYSSALGISKGATDDAIQRNEKLNESFSALINRTFVNLKKGGAQLGENTLAPGMQRVLKGVNAVLESADLGASGETLGGKLTTGISKGIGDFLGGPGLAVGIMALFKLFDKLRVYATDALKSISGGGKHMERQARVQGQINTLLAKEPTLLNEVLNGTRSIQDLHEILLKNIKEENREMARQASIVKTLSKGLSTEVDVTDTGVLISSPTSTSSSGRPRPSAYKGSIPNFFYDPMKEEEANARAIGAASGVKAHMSRGTVGGKRVIMNNQEEEVTANEIKQKYGVSPKGGDSAILPKYKPEVKKEFEERLERVQSGDLNTIGYIPNFADQRSTALSKGKINLIRKAFKDIDAASGVVDASDIASMIVPTKADTFGIGRYMTNDDRGNKVKLEARFPIKGAKHAPDDSAHQDSIKQKIAGVVKDYAYNSFVLPADKTSIDKYVTEVTKGSQLSQAVGRTFENSVQALVNKDDDFAKDARARWDFAEGRDGGYQNLRQVFGVKASLTDAKASTAPTNLNSMSEKFFEATEVGRRIVSTVQNFRSQMDPDSVSSKTKGLIATELKGVDIKENRGRALDIAKSYLRGTSLKEGESLESKAQELLTDDEFIKLHEKKKVSFAKAQADSKKKTGRFYGHLPNFVRRSNFGDRLRQGKRIAFEDFDENLVTYPEGTQRRELFDPESVDKAVLTKRGKSKVGYHHPVAILTARNSAAKGKIQDKMAQNNIPIDKVIATANMFNDLKIATDDSGRIIRNPSRSGRISGYRNLKPADKKSLLLQRIQEKFGGEYQLWDDSPENINKIKSLGNPKIIGHLTKETAHAGRGSGNWDGSVPSFFDMKRKKYRDGRFNSITSHDEEGKQVGKLNYDETETALEVSYNESQAKGAGFKQFKNLMRESVATRKPITSGNLVSQVAHDASKFETLSTISPFEQMSRHAFPQLRHRQVKGAKTSGKAQFLLKDAGGRNQPTFEFKTLRDLKGKSNQIKKEIFARGLTQNTVSINDLKTTAGNKTGLFKRDDSKLLKSGGFIPSFSAVAGYTENDLMRWHQAQGWVGKDNPAWSSASTKSQTVQKIQAAKAQKRLPVLILDNLSEPVDKPGMMGTPAKKHGDLPASDAYQDNVAKYGFNQQIPDIRKKFDSSIDKNWPPMIGNIATDILGTLKDDENEFLIKNFNPHPLSANSKESVEGLLFEDFVKGMHEKVVAGKETGRESIDLEEFALDPRFRGIFTKGLPSSGAEIKRTGIKPVDARRKLGIKFGGVLPNFVEATSNTWVPNFYGDELKKSQEREVKGLMKRDKFLTRSKAKELTYVGKDKRITANKDHLGIFNLIDEPRGPQQGVNRAISEGKNINTYGMKAAGGHLPNFVEEEEGGIAKLINTINTKLEGTGVGQTIETSAIGSVTAALKELNAESKDLQKHLKDATAAEAERASEISNAEAVMASSAASSDAYKEAEAKKNRLLEASTQVAQEKIVATQKLNSLDDERIDILGEQANEINETLREGTGTTAKKAAAGTAGKGAGGINLGRKEQIAEKASSDMLQKTFMLSTSLSVVSEIAPSMSFLTDAVSGAANTFTSVTQVIPGTVGKLIGGVLAGAAAASALKDAFFDASSGIKEISRRAEESQARFSALNDSISQYTSTFDQLTNALKDTTTPAETLMKLEDKLEKIIADMPTDAANRMTASTTIDEVKNTGENIRAEEELKDKRIQLAKTLLDMNKAAESGITSFLSFGDMDNAFMKGGFLGFGKELDVYGRDKQARNVMNAVTREDPETGEITTLRDAIVSGEVSADMLQQAGQGKGLDQLASMGFDLDDLEALAHIDGDMFDTLADGIQVMGEDAIKTSERYDKLSERMRIQAEEQRQLAEAAARAGAAFRRAVSDFNEAVKFDIFKGNEQGRSDKRVGLNKFQGSVNLAGAAGGLGGRKTDFEAGIKIIQTQNQAVDQIGQRADDFKGGQLDSISQAIADAQGEAVSDDVKNDLAEANRQISEFVKNNKGADSQTFQTGLDALINNLDDGLNVGDLDLSALSGDLKSEFEKLRRENSKTLAKMEEDLAIQKENLKVQKAIETKQQGIKSMGGIEAFLDPSKMDATFNKFYENLDALRLARQGGFKGQEARARGNLALTAMEMAGGKSVFASSNVNFDKGQVLDPTTGLMRDETFTEQQTRINEEMMQNNPQLAQMRDDVIQNMAAANKDKATRMADQLDERGLHDQAQTFRDLAANAVENATMAFDAKFKTDMVPKQQLDELKKIERLLATKLGTGDAASGAELNDPAARSNAVNQAAGDMANAAADSRAAAQALSDFKKGLTPEAMQANQQQMAEKQAERRGQLEDLADNTDIKTALFDMDRGKRKDVMRQLYDGGFTGRTPEEVESHVNKLNLTDIQKTRLTGALRGGINDGGVLGNKLRDTGSTTQVARITRQKHALNQQIQTLETEKRTLQAGPRDQNSLRRIEEIDEKIGDLEKQKARVKARGFIPSGTAALERTSARQSGYNAGAIRSMNIAGEGNVVYNSAEKVIKLPGFTQPFINPPEFSRAGKEHKDNSIKQLGLDPYSLQAATGFFPNARVNQIAVDRILKDIQFRHGGLADEADRQGRGGGISLEGVTQDRNQVKFWRGLMNWITRGDKTLGPNVRINRGGSNKISLDGMSLDEMESGSIEAGYTKGPFAFASLMRGGAGAQLILFQHLKKLGYKGDQSDINRQFSRVGRNTQETDLIKRTSNMIEHERIIEAKRIEEERAKAERKRAAKAEADAKAKSAAMDSLGGITEKNRADMDLERTRARQRSAEKREEAARRNAARRTGPSEEYREHQRGIDEGNFKRGEDAARRSRVKRQALDLAERMNEKRREVELRQRAERAARASTPASYESKWNEARQNMGAAFGESGDTEEIDRQKRADKRQRDRGTNRGERGSGRTRVQTGRSAPADVPQFSFGGRDVHIQEALGEEDNPTRKFFSMGNARMDFLKNYRRKDMVYRTMMARQANPTTRLSNSQFRATYNALTDPNSPHKIDFDLDQGLGGRTRVNADGIPIMNEGTFVRAQHTTNEFGRSTVTMGGGTDDINAFRGLMGHEISHAIDNYQGKQRGDQAIVESLKQINGGKNPGNIVEFADAVLKLPQGQVKTTLIEQLRHWGVIKQQAGLGYNTGKLVVDRGTTGAGGGGAGGLEARVLSGDDLDSYNRVKNLSNRILNGSPIGSSDQPESIKIGRDNLKITSQTTPAADIDAKATKQFIIEHGGMKTLFDSPEKAMAFINEVQNRNLASSDPDFALKTVEEMRAYAVEDRVMKDLDGEGKKNFLRREWDKRKMLTGMDDADGLLNKAKLFLGGQQRMGLWQGIKDWSQWGNNWQGDSVRMMKGDENYQKQKGRILHKSLPKTDILKNLDAMNNVVNHIQDKNYSGMVNGRDAHTGKRYSDGGEQAFKLRQAINSAYQKEYARVQGRVLNGTAANEDFVKLQGMVDDMVGTVDTKDRGKIMSAASGDNAPLVRSLIGGAENNTVQKYIDEGRQLYIDDIANTPRATGDADSMRAIYDKMFADSRFTEAYSESMSEEMVKGNKGSGHGKKLAKLWSRTSSLGQGQGGMFVKGVGGAFATTYVGGMLEKYLKENHPEWETAIALASGIKHHGGLGVAGLLGVSAWRQAGQAAMDMSPEMMAQMKEQYIRDQVAKGAKGQRLPRVRNTIADFLEGIGSKTTSGGWFSKIFSGGGFMKGAGAALRGAAGMANPLNWGRSIMGTNVVDDVTDDATRSLANKLRPADVLDEDVLARQAADSWSPSKAMDNNIKKGRMGVLKSMGLGLGGNLLTAHMINKRAMEGSEGVAGIEELKKRLEAGDLSAGMQMYSTQQAMEDDSFAARTAIEIGMLGYMASAGAVGGPLGLAIAGGMMALDAAGSGRRNRLASIESGKLRMQSGMNRIGQVRGQAQVTKYKSLLDTMGMQTADNNRIGLSIARDRMSAGGANHEQMAAADDVMAFMLQDEAKASTLISKSLQKNELMKAAALTPTELQAMYDTRDEAGSGWGRYKALLGGMGSVGHEDIDKASDDAYNMIQNLNLMKKQYGLDFKDMKAVTNKEGKLALQYGRPTENISFGSRMDVDALTARKKLNSDLGNFWGGDDFALDFETLLKQRQGLRAAELFETQAGADVVQKSERNAAQSFLLSQFDGDVDDAEKMNEIAQHIRRKNKEAYEQAMGPRNSKQRKVMALFEAKSLEEKDAAVKGLKQSGMNDRQIEILRNRFAKMGSKDLQHQRRMAENHEIADDLVDVRTGKNLRPDMKLFTDPKDGRQYYFDGLKKVEALTKASYVARLHATGQLRRELVKDEDGRNIGIKIFQKDGTGEKLLTTHMGDSDKNLVSKLNDKIFGEQALAMKEQDFSLAQRQQMIERKGRYAGYGGRHRSTGFIGDDKSMFDDDLNRGRIAEAWQDLRTSKPGGTESNKREVEAKKQRLKKLLSKKFIVQMARRAKKIKETPGADAKRKLRQLMVRDALSYRAWFERSGIQWDGASDINKLGMESFRHGAEGLSTTFNSATADSINDEYRKGLQEVAARGGQMGQLDAAGNISVQKEDWSNQTIAVLQEKIQAADTPPELKEKYKDQLRHLSGQKLNNANTLQRQLIAAEAQLAAARADGSETPEMRRRLADLSRQRNQAIVGGYEVAGAAGMNFAHEFEVTGRDGGKTTLGDKYKIPLTMRGDTATMRNLVAAGIRAENIEREINRLSSVRPAAGSQEERKLKRLQQMRAANVNFINTTSESHRENLQNSMQNDPSKSLAMNLLNAEHLKSKGEGLGDLAGFAGMLNSQGRLEGPIGEAVGIMMNDSIPEDDVRKIRARQRLPDMVGNIQKSRAQAVLDGGAITVVGGDRRNRIFGAGDVAQTGLAHFAGDNFDRSRHHSKAGMLARETRGTTADNLDRLSAAAKELNMDPMTFMEFFVNRKGSGLFEGGSEGEKLAFIDNMSTLLASYNAHQQDTSPDKKPFNLTLDKVKEARELRRRRKSVRPAGQFSGLPNVPAATGLPEDMMYVPPTSGPADRMEVTQLDENPAYNIVINGEKKKLKFNPETGKWHEIGEGGLPRGTGVSHSKFLVDAQNYIKSKPVDKLREEFKGGKGNQQLAEQMAAIKSIEEMIEEERKRRAQVIVPTKAGGFIPNFANSKPISKTLYRGFIPDFNTELAISKDREVQALVSRGVSPREAKGSVYVAKHPAITSNKEHIGVFNRIDEPMGPHQGINRARSEGQAVNTYGSGTVPTFSKSTVPNFAEAEKNMNSVAQAFGEIAKAAESMTPQDKPEEIKEIQSISSQKTINTNVNVSVKGSVNSVPNAIASAVIDWSKKNIIKGGGYFPPNRRS